MKRSKVSIRQCAALLSAFLLFATPGHAQAESLRPPAPNVPDMAEEAFRYGDFDELERLYAIYGKPGVRSPLTGTPRLEHFWMGIGKITSSTLKVTESYYQQMDVLTRQWSLDHPQSVLAHLLYVESLISHAWAIRGNGYNNTVSPEARAGFLKYLDQALMLLRQSEALAAQDSSWNLMMLRIGRSLGWSFDKQIALFEKGIAKNPDHDELYFQMQESLLPKWGGDMESEERFIAWVTENTREKRGMEMYARLYAGLSIAEVKQSLFTATHASWPKMKAGFEDRLSRYPDADHRNQYARFACLARDLPALREQLDILGPDGFEPIFWGDGPQQRFEECKALVQKL